jgi:hypothetical protein
VGAVNEQSEHLSNAQIENYGDRTSGAEPDADREAELVEAHLQDCSSCRSRLLDFQRAHFALLADPKQPTDHTVNPASTPDCPSEDDLRQLAAGLLPEAVGDKLTRHAAICDHCGPLLRIYTEDFSDDFSQEEQAVLSSLQSSSAQWQKKTAQQMLGAARATAAGVRAGASATEVNAGMAIAVSPARGPSALTSRSPLFWKWIIPAATAACTLIALSIWYSQRDTPEKVEKLLAQAYTEQRTMEMRWPGAEHSAVKLKLGSANTDQPIELLEAQHAIDRHPAKESWILETASLAILKRRPASAIHLLEPIAGDSSNCSRCMLILAIAEVMEGDSTGNVGNYEHALKLLTNIPSLSPDFNVAIYNRALVFERLGRTSDAIADWQTFARIEKDPDWASDGNQRLHSLRTLAPK